MQFKFKHWKLISASTVVFVFHNTNSKSQKQSEILKINFQSFIPIQVFVDITIVIHYYKSYPAMKILYRNVLYMIVQQINSVFPLW